MKKILLIMEREYLTRVKKRAFLITTLVAPLIMFLFFGFSFFVSMDDSHVEKNKILVWDERGILDGVEDSIPDMPQLTFVTDSSAETWKKNYESKGYDGFLFIPKDSSKSITLFSKQSISLSTREQLKELIRSSFMAKKWELLGVDGNDISRWKNSIQIKNIVENNEVARETEAGVGYLVSFGCGLLIYLLMVMYGTQVMRGVSEEKINRIAEVIISSARPFQLMMGKILGIGAVGLTQFGIWVALLYTLQLAFVPGIQTMHSIPGVPAHFMQPEMIESGLKGLESLPIFSILACFVFYFLFGYLLYASLFAALGSIVSEDQQEVQQMMFPLLMPIILSFVILTKVINDPNTNEAVFFSIFPFTSPIVMMGRITYGVPLWQLGLSMGLLVLSFLFFTWFAAKIYRTGILMYGKKISWKEMIKWGFRKAD
jgi:ABC-2 type transport system permease protein